MAFDVKTAAAKLMKIADAIEKEAYDNAYFVCDKCNHTANLTTIDQRRKKVAAQLGAKKVSSVSIDDVFSCPACGGDMKYMPTSSSAKYFVEAADEGMVVAPPPPPEDGSEVPPLDPKKKPVLPPMAPPTGDPMAPPADAVPPPADPMAPPMDAMPTDMAPPPEGETPTNVFDPVDEQAEKKEVEEGEGVPGDIEKDDEDLDYDSLGEDDDLDEEGDKPEDYEENKDTEEGDKPDEDKPEEGTEEDKKPEEGETPIEMPPEEPSTDEPATDPLTGETPIGEVPSSPESPAEPVPSTDKPRKRKNVGNPDETPKFEKMPPNKEAADQSFWKAVAKYTV